MPLPCYILEWCSPNCKCYGQVTIAAQRLPNRLRSVAYRRPHSARLGQSYLLQVGHIAITPLTELVRLAGKGGSSLLPC